MTFREQWLPFYTLLKKEIMRFFAVSAQTLLAPTVTTALYLFIFGVGLGSQVDLGHGFTFIQFVVPGLILMGITNNAFSNSSSSIFLSRYIGNIVDYLVLPISPFQFMMAYSIAGMIRGILVGVAIWVVSLFFASMPWEHVFYGFLVAMIASYTFSALGIIAAIYSGTFDHLAVFLNFIITPMVFLGGVFYPISKLPPFWSKVSHLNPVFYYVDGFRYGALGFSEVDPMISLAISSLLCVVFSIWAILLLRSGYKLKS